MLKPLTLSLSLAFALGFCGLSMAGGLCASPQCPSPQGPAPSAQCGTPTWPPKKSCNLFSGMGSLCNNLKTLCTPKPKCYTYTWVLKKKRVWGCGGSGWASPTCDTCGVYPSGQGVAPSGQASYAAPQAYGTGQAYGAGQTASIIASPAPAIATAPTGDEAPPAPEIAPSIPASPVPATGPQSSLLFSTTPTGN